MTPTIPVATLLAEVVPLALGVLVAAGGAAACLLSIPLLRRRNPNLLYLGIAAAMYGVRLVATTATARYLAPDSTFLLDLANWIVTGLILVPLGLFFAQAVVAPEWRRALLWIVGAEALEGALYLAAHARGRGHGWDTFNSVIALPLLLLFFFYPRRKEESGLWALRGAFLVLVGLAAYTNAVELHLAPGTTGSEFVGFVILLSAVGYVTARRTLRNERNLLAIRKELDVARRIQAGLLPDHDAAVPGLQVAARYLPVSAVAGDFYDFLPAGPTRLGILIADVTGHGVPAALAASMAKIAFRVQEPYAQSPGEVLGGMNSILHGSLRGQYVTAGYLLVDVGQGLLKYAGAGHPPLLVWRAAKRQVESIAENGLLLGAFPKCEYKTLMSAFEPGDRCLLYTDGVLEAPSPTGEEFGSERLQAFLADQAGRTPREVCDALVEALRRWCALPKDQERHDDITVLVVASEAPALP